MIKRLHSWNAAPWVAIIISGGLLGGAYFFQYVLGYLPCTMCYWQRHAHKAVLVVAILALLLLRRYGAKALWHWTIVLALLVSFGMAAWHVAVEFGFLEGPQTCAAGGGDMPEIDPNDPLAFLDKSIKPPACSEPVWFFLGLSMAAWNALISLIAAVWIATSKKI